MSPASILLIASGSGCVADTLLLYHKLGNMYIYIVSYCDFSGTHKPKNCTDKKGNTVRGPVIAQKL